MTNTILIFAAAFAAVLAGVLVFSIIIINRGVRSAKTLAQILIDPSAAKLDDAKDLVAQLSSQHLAAVGASVSKMSANIELQIKRAEQISENLASDNARLVGTANSAAENLAKMTTLLDAKLSQFHSVVSSKEWEDISKNAREFNANTAELFKQADHLSIDVADRVSALKHCFAEFDEDSKRLNTTLSANLEGNTAQMNSFSVESDALISRLSALLESVADKFARVKDESAGLETNLRSNEKLVDAHMDKIATYTRQSKMLLDQQLGGLTNTASAVGSQIRLAESSIDKQQQILEKSVQTLMEHATDTEGFVKGISTQITTLTGRLQNEVRDMVTGMLTSLAQVSDNAETALAQTGQASAAFADSMNQARDMIEVSREVTGQLEPLSKLIVEYHDTLPALAKSSEQISEKIHQLGQAAGDSAVGLADSSLKLEKLTEQSRQMMIELLSDYSDALTKMEHLTKEMESARSSVSVKKIEQKNAPATESFMARAGGMIEKLNEISVDLAQAAQTEIPDVIWDRYNGGDKAVFSKWFAKLIAAADKKRFKALFKSDSSFRGSATLFLRGFHKMLLDAQADDNKDAITSTLLKTDIGRVYLAMKELIS